MKKRRFSQINAKWIKIKLLSTLIRVDLRFQTNTLNR